MTYAVEWTKAASKELSKLPRSVQVQVVEAVTTFAATGRGDIRKLAGRQEHWRLRVGDYRVVFTRRKGELLLTIVVVKVGNRRDVYD
ncbi:MAG: type II toxin-antitoxin system RelE family toxin [Candidatus Sericytochromatia bacterium]